MDERDDDIRLQALYRSAAREAPSAAMDSAILGAAAAKVRRDRVTPILAIAAGLVVAVLIVRGMALPTPGAAPQETRSYLLALHTPPVDAATEARP